MEIIVGLGVGYRPEEFLGPELPEAMKDGLLMSARNPVGRPEKVREMLQPVLEALRAEAGEDRSDLAIMKDVDEASLLETCFLVGSPLEVLDRLKALQAAVGVNHLLCRVHLPGRKHLDVVDCIRLLASQLHTRMVA